MSTIKVDTLDTRTGTGNITISRPLTGLSGSGASLTALNATELTSGTLPMARIADDAVTTAKIADAVALGGPSLGTSSVIRTNANTISENITFLTNTNGSSVGTITIASGSTVTITSGALWKIL